MYNVHCTLYIEHFPLKDNELMNIIYVIYEHIIWNSLECYYEHSLLAKPAPSSIYTVMLINHY